MGNTTENLKLVLTGTSPEDMALTFSEWRQLINGEDGSAFVLIDKAYGAMKTSIDNKLGKTAKAADSAKLGGKAAADYATAAELSKVTESVSKITQSLEDAAKIHRYGVLWDKTNAACTRLYDAIGMTAAAHIRLPLPPTAARTACML